MPILYTEIVCATDCSGVGECLESVSLSPWNGGVWIIHHRSGPAHPVDNEVSGEES